MNGSGEIPAHEPRAPVADRGLVQVQPQDATAPAAAELSQGGWLNFGAFRWSDTDVPRALLIVAARLTLVPLRPEHAAEMAPILADPDLYTFTGGAPPQAAELRARFERCGRTVSNDGG